MLSADCLRKRTEMDNTYVYYYSRLSERLQREVYLPLLRALQSHREKCALPFVAAEELERVLDCILLEHPLISFYSEYSFRTFKDLVFSVEFKYLLNEEQQRAVEEDIVSFANSVASRARSVSDDPFMQVKSVYEQISRGVAYDTEYHSYSFNAAGVLYGRAVCLGISLGFKLISDIIGIPSFVVRGAHGGEPHAWSMVCLGGGWYPCDLTVGVCQTTAEEGVCYDGLCALPNREMYKAWESFPIPDL